MNVRRSNSLRCSMILTAPCRSLSRTSTVIVLSVLKRKCGLSCAWKRSEARAGELFGESCYLHFALARVDEVTSGVFDSDDAEINRDAERQRSEDPAQPFDANLKPEFCRAVLHRVVINIRRKDPDQNQRNT